MRPNWWILLALAVVAGRAAEAQAPRIDCAAPQSTVEIGYCLEQELKREDAGLNQVYQQALRATRGNDMMSAQDKKNWEAALRDAQRKWVAFRDADCGELTGYEWFGGTGMGAATLSCKAEKTKTRTRELTERYLQR